MKHSLALWVPGDAKLGICRDSVGSGAGGPCEACHWGASSPPQVLGIEASPWGGGLPAGSQLDSTFGAEFFKGQGREKSSFKCRYRLLTWD